MQIRKQYDTRQNITICHLKRSQEIYVLSLHFCFIMVPRSFDSRCSLADSFPPGEALGAAGRSWCVISNIEYRFYKAYGMEIDDKRTVYADCAFWLVPRDDEPSVCLMHDWIYLPSA